MNKYLFAALFLPVCLLGKTLVFTTAFNRPDFVELQDKLFKKFLEDDYEFWVISDANTPERQSSIKEICDARGIQFRQVPQEIHDRPYLPRGPELSFHNPNVRHCNSAQWAWDNFFSHHDGPVMIIDSDLFLIRPFSIEKALKNKHLGGIYSGTLDMVTGEPVSYLWLVLILFNNPVLPERESICFNCGYIPGTNAVCDSGGWTNLYLNKYKDLLKVNALNFVTGNKFFCPYRYSQQPQNFDELSASYITQNLTERGFTDAEIRLALKKPYTIELFGDNQFLHYRAGTNYENYTNEFLSDKDKVLMEFFNEILQSDCQKPKEQD